MRKTIAAGVVAGFVLAAGFAAPAQAISATTADLSVLHGIPGLDRGRVRQRRSDTR